MNEGMDVVMKNAFETEKNMTSVEVVEDALVTKCVSLLDLWRTEMTLSEFKILDLYLSRINYRDPDTRIVYFSKKEVEDIFGVKIDAKVLKYRLTHLLKNQVSLPFSGKKGVYFKTVNLFEMACYSEDAPINKRVEISCTQAASRYFFNYEEIGYLRYSLNSVIKLKSRYSYIMFLYLEKNRMIQNEWEESVTYLKELFHCDDSAVFSEYRVFNDKVLKVAYKEITTKTSCWYSYAPGKKDGKRIVSIKFTLQDIEEAKICGKAPDVICGMIRSDVVDQVFNNIRDTATGMVNNFLPEEHNNRIPDYMEPIKKFGDLTPRNVSELDALLRIIPLKKIWWADETLSNEENYKKYLALKAKVIEGKGDRIKRKVRYLIKMINTEIEEFSLKGGSKEPPKTSAEKYLSRYSQREYSKEEMEEIEMRMLEKSLGPLFRERNNTSKE